MKQKKNTFTSLNHRDAMEDIKLAPQKDSEPPLQKQVTGYI